MPSLQKGGFSEETAIALFNLVLCWIDGRKRRFVCQRWGVAVALTMVEDITHRRTAGTMLAARGRLTEADRTKIHELVITMAGTSKQATIQPEDKSGGDDCVKLADVLISALGCSINDQVEISITQDGGALQLTKMTDTPY